MHGPHLHFEIRSTPFNYTTGRLAADKSQWISNDNTDGAELPRLLINKFVLLPPTLFMFPKRGTGFFPNSGKLYTYLYYLLFCGLTPPRRTTTRVPIEPIPLLTHHEIVVKFRLNMITRILISNFSTHRTKLVLHQPDIPTRSSAPLPVDSKHDQYVEFTHSDLEADAAQSTVPFIDIQPVEPLKGAGLNSGAGIMHRGARGSGGYIALKLFTYDYSKHVKAEAPPEDFNDVDDTTDFMPVVN